MSKASELFQELREAQAALDNLTVMELRSLQPAYNEYLNNYIDNLIKEKDDTQSRVF